MITRSKFLGTLYHKYKWSLSMKTDHETLNDCDYKWFCDRLIIELISKPTVDSLNFNIIINRVSGIP